MEAQTVFDPSDNADHLNSFKLLVLEHIKNKLDPQQWRRFREYSQVGATYCGGNGCDANSTPEELIGVGHYKALMTSYCDLSEYLRAYGKSAEIVGYVESIPAYYFPQVGVYAWSIASDANYVFEVWLTHPAYPEKWDITNSTNEDQYSMERKYVAEKSEHFMLRIVEGGYAVMVAQEPGDTPEILKPRPDLYQYSGGYAWGYSGTGVLNLAYAIMANFSDDLQNINTNAALLVERVLSKLDGEKSHDLTRVQIIEQLQID